MTIPSALSKLKAAIPALLLCLLMGLAPGASAQNLSIWFDGAAFHVGGWNKLPAEPAKGWASVFQVYSGTGDVPAMVGSYAIEGGALVFHPEFPIAPGVHYRAVYTPPGGGAAIEKEFDGPPRPTNPVARVEAIYPSGDVWPSNDLRLYIYFSAPMSRNESARYFHLLDENGKDLTGPAGVILPGEELWDPGFTRLTLTFDPGHIKRGLTSNEEVGMPIANGKRYTIVIDRDWQDARGVPLVEGYRKTFRGGPAIRTQPDPKQWRITSPKPGTTEPLEVTFTEPMNYALLQRMLRVTMGKANIAGKISVAGAETQWRFTPEQPWSAGDYQLVVDTGLEDIAGNSIEQLFDIDVFNQVTEHITSTFVSLPFSVR